MTTTAISSTSTALPPILGGDPKTGGAEVALQKLRKEYSACVNCDTADTPEGKRNIDDLGNQIRVLEERLRPVEETPAIIEPQRIPGEPGALVDVRV